MPNTKEIVDALTHFAGSDWDELDSLVEQLWETGEPQLGMNALFGIFERYPEEDGSGVFWTILHGLERLPNYEGALVASLRRQPTEFNVLMVNRILNVGQEGIGGVSGLILLQEVLRHLEAALSARWDAERFLQRHSQ